MSFLSDFRLSCVDLLVRNLASGRGPAAGARYIQFLTHESTPLSIDPYSMVPDSRVCPNRKAAVANSLLVEGSRLCKIPLLFLIIKLHYS